MKLMDLLGSELFDKISACYYRGKYHQYKGTLLTQAKKNNVY